MRIHPKSLARAGFTLIELLVVIAIISILALFLLPKIPEAFDAARVTGCKKNLEEIYKGLLSYERKFGRIPNQSGVRFFAELIPSKVWENTPGSARRLTCPGVDVGALAIGQIEDETQWFSDLEVLDGSYSSYAGRDCKNHPLRKLTTGKEALVADDNDGGPNHSSTTNVLYGDGSVESFEIYDLIKNGTLGPEEELLVVGPDSPVEDLRKFSLD